MADVALASARAWWASSRRSSRGAVLGAVILVLALATVSAIVWISPNSPVRQAERVVSSWTGKDELVAQRNQLLSESVALEAKLKAAWSKSGKSDAQAAALRSQIADLRAQLADAQTRLAAKPAATGTPATTRTTVTRTTTASAGVKPAAITAPPLAQVADPANPYFGLYTEQAPFNWSEFDSVAARVGQMPASVGFFAGWDQPYRSSGVIRAWQRGLVPVYTWESRPIDAPNSQKNDPDYTLAKIIDGDFDAYLHQFAADVRTTGLPVVIRLDHEMNGDWYPWSEATNSNSPGQFAEMWRHVHDIFQQEGANDQVVWLWSPNRIDRLLSRYQSIDYLRSLYPGDDYVDWVGMSGYLRSGNDSPTFSTTFGRTLAQLRSIAAGKKIFLSEVGATETGGKKPAWTASFFQGLDDPANADIVGFGWFNLTVTSYAESDTSTNDWRLTSTRQSLAAFIAGLTGPGTRFASRPV